MNIKHLHEAPSLTTALTGPLHELESHLLDRQNAIETWFRQQWLINKPPFYASVDIRNAGFKVAPVDTNLFPAGFNNINREFAPLCIQAIQTALDKVCPDAVRVMILPENHTRNMAYMDSIATLQELMIQSGYETRIGTINPEITETTSITLDSGKTLSLELIHREGDRLMAGDFDPCVIVLNNDLSSGVPTELDGISQVITPPPDLGWNKRLKSEHFEFYRLLAIEFSKMIDIDPWFFDPLFRNCGELNFMERKGEDCLYENTAKLLADIQEKYNQHGIDSAPYIIIKADAGTYGMGIMTVRSPEDVIDLNRKQRTRMSASKGGKLIHKVILQEGVPTYETWGDAASVAEPVVYMMDRYVVGGFYRVHTKRGTDENLNAPGMHFQPLAFDEPCNVPDAAIDPDATPNRFYTYGVIARLALLAAAREIHDVSGD
ncbi:MAG: glutamate--cysteine ligase [Gammaproteobacteria bacterium]|nr:glutamate--cysteine ligase [Gammaproteobacteria bacterium]